MVIPSLFLLHPPSLLLSFKTGSGFHYLLQFTNGNVPRTRRVAKHSSEVRQKLAKAASVAHCYVMCVTRPIRKQFAIETLVNFD
jgi:hypothetical protein